MSAAGSKVRIARILKSWAVSCDECADAGSLIHFMRPWAVAADHATALTLARWHVGEHAARNCRHCKRPYALPAITPIDKTHVNFDGLLYEVRSDGVHAIGAASNGAAV